MNHERMGPPPSRTKSILRKATVDITNLFGSEVTDVYVKPASLLKDSEILICVNDNDEVTKAFHEDAKLQQTYHMILKKYNLSPTQVNIDEKDNYRITHADLETYKNLFSRN